MSTAKAQPFTKVDNAPWAHEAKLGLRRKVLDVVRPARVFDGFAGAGQMYAGAWCGAAEYTACDQREWAVGDSPRFIADVLLVLRALDLQRFNVFDFDAYGSPWEAMAILAARRPWAPGEAGAVVLTDGSHTPMRTAASRGAHISAGLRWLGSVQPTGSDHAHGLFKQADAAQDGALRTWAARSRVEPLHLWQASTPSRTRMRYTALVFRGAQPTTGSET